MRQKRLRTTGLGCWRDRPFLDRTRLVFDEVVPMGRQEATRPDSDEDSICIGEFPCYSHYAERLARLKQVPILIASYRKYTGHEASALPTRPHVRQTQLIANIIICALTLNIWTKTTYSLSLLVRSNKWKSFNLSRAVNSLCFRNSYHVIFSVCFSMYVILYLNRYCKFPLSNEC